MRRDAYDLDPTRPHRRVGAPLGRRLSTAALTVDPGSRHKRGGIPKSLVVKVFGTPAPDAPKRKSRKALRKEVAQQIVRAAQAKQVQTRGGGSRIAPRDTAYLARAQARLATLPSGFTDWVWDIEPLPDDVPELLGPRA